MRAIKFLFTVAVVGFCVAACPVRIYADESENGLAVTERYRNLGEAMRAIGPRDRIPVIITFKHAPTEEEYADLEKSSNLKPKYKYKIIPGAAATLNKGQINSLSKIDIVKKIEFDVALEYALDTATEWFGVNDVRADFELDGAGVTIAILDTGIDGGHVDFQGKILAFGDFTTSPPTFPVVGTDLQGHGTHCASIAAGAGNGNSAYKGVAPGANLVGAALGFDYAFASNVIAALEWIVIYYNPSRPDPEKVRVISMSFGTNEEVTTLDEAVRVAIGSGIVAVAAAGNEGPAQSTIRRSPGSLSEVITVGAMADVGEGGFFQAAFSSRGPTYLNDIKPDICAPGSNIMAAKAGTTDEYTSKTGTSMSTPFVAGVVALMLQTNNGLTPTQVKTQLMETAIDWGPLGLDNDYGAGRLDAYAAVAGLAGPSVPHFYVEETIAAKRNSDEWSINVTDATLPIAISLIALDWISSRDPDFDVYLYNPQGRRVASSGGDYRQDTITYQPTKTGDYKLIVQSSWGLGPYFFDLSAGAVGAVLTSDDDDTGGENGALHVMVTTNDSTYALRELVNVVVTVTEDTENGAWVEGASVHTEINTVSGKTYGADGTTNSNGQAFFDFRPKKPDGEGTYTVMATASMSGYDPANGFTTFIVGNGTTAQQEVAEALEKNPQTADDSSEIEGYGMFGPEENIALMLIEAVWTINELGLDSFNNEESGFELACAINDAFTLLDEGMYFESLILLDSDILVRMDGCANIGEPDEDDWITSVEGQALLYPLLTETIELLENLL